MLLQGLPGEKGEKGEPGPDGHPVSSSCITLTALKPHDYN